MRLWGPRITLAVGSLLGVVMFNGCAHHIVSPRAEVNNKASATASVGNSARTTNQIAATGLEQRYEAIRNACIEGRRRICGRVMEVSTNGLVVDSGFTSLLRPELSRSWVAPSTVAAERPANIIEENTPGAPAVGLVLLTGVPRRPAVHTYDFVVIEAYPAGDVTYTPVPGITKTIRRFSATLELAIRLSFEETATHSSR